MEHTMIIAIPTSISLYAVDDLRGTILAQLALQGIQHAELVHITLNDVRVVNEFSQRYGTRSRRIFLLVTAFVDTAGFGLDASTDVYALDMDELRLAAHLGGWADTIHDWSEAAIARARHLS